MRYLGRRTLWERILDPDGAVPTRHVHTCPMCRAHVPCRMDCTLHPEMELDDGTPGGAYSLCSACVDKVRVTTLTLPISYGSTDTSNYTIYYDEAV